MDNLETPITRPYADHRTKKWNDPESAIFGSCNFGCAYYGDDSAGIFQTIHTRHGKISRKLRYYVPTYSESEPLVANREKFADAVSAYQALSPFEKNVYKALATNKPYSGYNLFLRKYMLN